MATIQVYRILVGARSATISILTDTPESVSIHYKPALGEWKEMACTENENFFFIVSAWEVDLDGILQPETQYSLYVSAGSVNSATYSFTTESLGSFGNYNFGYFVYDDAAGNVLYPHPTWTPGSADKEYAEGIVNTFTQKLEDIGFQMSVFQAEYPDFVPSIYIVDYFNRGAAGLTNNFHGECWFVKRANLGTYIHEYRHCFYFFDDYSANNSIGNAVNLRPSEVSKMGRENFYKVFSMFSINGDKTEPQTFYGENSCDHGGHLYDFFILKLLALHPLTIIDG